MCKVHALYPRHIGEANLHTKLLNLLNNRLIEHLQVIVSICIALINSLAHLIISGHEGL
jgi:hypothetical protein